VKQVSRLRLFSIHLEFGIDSQFREGFYDSTRIKPSFIGVIIHTVNDEQRIELDALLAQSFCLRKCSCTVYGFGLQRIVLYLRLLIATRISRSL